MIAHTLPPRAASNAAHIAAQSTISPRAADSSMAMTVRPASKEFVSVTGNLPRRNSSRRVGEAAVICGVGAALLWDGALRRTRARDSHQMAKTAQRLGALRG